MVADINDAIGNVSDLLFSTAQKTLVLVNFGDPANAGYLGLTILSYLFSFRIVEELIP